MVDRSFCRFAVSTLWKFALGWSFLIVLGLWLQKRDPQNRALLVGFVEFLIRFTVLPLEVENHFHQIRRGTEINQFHP